MVKSVYLAGLMLGLLFLTAACGVGLEPVSGLKEIQGEQSPAVVEQKPVVEVEPETVKEEVEIETVEVEPETETGLTEEQARILASLPSKGLAPELTNEIFLNSEPLRLADLRGKVVIVEFWTYG